jgi:hypothetical protein
VPLTIDAEQASAFFRMLHGDGQVETEIRCIHPDRSKPVWNFWGSLEDPRFCEPFRELNDDGYGIYLVINEPDQEAGKKRVHDQKKGIEDAQIRRITSLFVEMDEEDEPGANLEKLQNAPLLPSAIIRSSTEEKLHGYWFVVDCPVELFTPLQMQLIALFGSDPTCKNPSRVMRLPGFWHTKRQPIRSEIIDGEGAQYTLTEICEAFGLDPELKIERSAAPIPDDWTPPAGIHERILRAAQKHAAKIPDGGTGRHKTLIWLALAAKENRLPESDAQAIAAQALPYLPTREGVPVELSEAIDAINWVYAKADAGKPWVSGSSGNPVQVAERPRAPPDEGDPLKSEPATVDVTIRNHGYALVKERKVGKDQYETYYEQLTNWTFTPTILLIYPGGLRGERGVLSINDVRRHEIDLPSKTWSGRRDILEVVGAYGGVCFTNSSSDIAKIRQFIDLHYAGLPSAAGVNSYGLHHHAGAWLELFEDTTLGDFETPPLFYAGTPVDPGSVAHAAPRTGSDTKLARVRDALPQLQLLGTRSTSLAITGYAVASAFAPRITPYLGRKLPFCYITGEREVGKSSLLEINLELTTGNRSPRLQKAPGMTPYQYDVAFSNANNLLGVLDEYRAGAVDDAQFRKHYDLGTKWRGSGVAAKDHAYLLNSPLIVAGEGFTDDAAALSRGVLYFLEKKDRGTLELFNELAGVPWYAYAYHLHELARTLPEEKHRARIERARTVAKHAGQGANPRLVYALTFIAYGLYLLHDDVDPVAYSEHNILATLQWGREHTLDGENEGTTNLEMFLEQLGSVVSEHKDPESIVTPASVVGKLIIKISPSVEFVKRRYGERAAIGNTRLLRRYAEQVDYIDSGTSTHKDFRGKVIRGIKIDLDVVPSRCDVEGLKHLEDLLRAKT